MTEKKKQTIRRVYSFIKYHIETKEYSPTYDVIALTLRMSEGNVHNAVDYLVNHDYLKRPKWAVLLLTEKEFK